MLRPLSQKSMRAVDTEPARSDGRRLN